VLGLRDGDRLHGVGEETLTDMKATTFARNVEKRVRTTLFIAGIALLGFMPIVFATFFLLVEGVAADVFWALGIGSVLGGMACLFTYGYAENKARRLESASPSASKEP
ncbi:MAG TPA: hypothetical protein VGB18_06870, partial [Candidatus Thermoplasmatota archaeon]